MRRSAIGADNAYKPTQKDVSGLPALFPANPARRVTATGGKAKAPRDDSKPKAANESDVSGRRALHGTRVDLAMALSDRGERR